MLNLNLMSEIICRAGSIGGVGHLLRDTALQAAMCLDAPDTVEDGVEWFEDYGMAGPVPRVVELRGG